MNLIIEMLVGLPASGKSTYALEKIKSNPDRWVRINKDELRKLHPNFPEKKIVEEEERQIIEAITIKNKNIILDNTHLNRIHFVRIKKLIENLAAKTDIHVEIKVNDSFLQVPIDECIRRDALRANGKCVGEKAIRDMWAKYSRDWDHVIRNKIFQEDSFAHKTDVILCDLDGTLAFAIDRGWFEEEKCESDIINFPLKTVLQALHLPIIFVSGRQDKARQATINFLSKHEIPFIGLFMRKTGDTRSDDIVKKEIFEKNIQKNFRVIMVFDDRPKVVDMWRSLGLVVADMNQTRSIF